MTNCAIINVRTYEKRDMKQRGNFMELESSILNIKGIGEKTAKLFYKVGIMTVGDLIEYYPRTYDVYEEPVSVLEARVLDFAAISGVIIATPTIKRVKNLQIISTQLRDKQGDCIRVSWFNMPFLRNTMKPGMRFVLRGRLQGYGESMTMEQPEIFTLGAYENQLGSMQPIYHLTSGLTNKMISKAVSQVFSDSFTIEDDLDEDFCKQYHLISKYEAIKQIHYPVSQIQYQRARRRLVFEEFYHFILGVRKLKEEIEQMPNHFSITEREEIKQLIEKLPYELTNAQKKVVQEIQQDLVGYKIMNRMVQGDVGSGKTIVSFLALMQVALCGYQGVLMAPTEVLAKQHFVALEKLLLQYEIPLKSELLTGSMTAREKRLAYERIANHEVDIIVGTHALIQEKVTYDKLALVVTDEQHRFGVKQRDALSEKGYTPHVLVMSATPIPRSLAIIIYGDLDISIINELPSNRLPIKNCVVDINYRPNAYEFIRKQIVAGRQAYVICPMVEESEQMDGENVIDYTEKLKEQLPSNINISYLHGKMDNKEKDRIMEAFGNKEIDILVSTTVIEVGIDVPNATVIMIENAQRFGLAQLHQLRGRVGRGKYQSYCILVNTSGSKSSKARLDILNKSNDGFFIASEDLKLRGPGDFFGVRQSGMLEFKLGDVYTDAELLKLASKAANESIDLKPLVKK